MTSRTRSAFGQELARRNTDPVGRRWVFVPYDQLSDGIGPLAEEDPRELGIVLLESPWKAGRRPYHKQKLALVLANLRHFALEQAARGVAVEHRVIAGSYGEALGEIAREKGGLRVMRPAERELRRDLASLVQEGVLELVPHQGWLTSREQFEASQKGGAPWRMDAFYRHVRREGGWLMDGLGKPLGGKFSFDAESREPWRGEPVAARPPEFAADAVTEEVATLVAQRHRALEIVGIGEIDIRLVHDHHDIFRRVPQVEQAAIAGHHIFNRRREGCCRRCCPELRGRSSFDRSPRRPWCRCG